MAHTGQEGYLVGAMNLASNAIDQMCSEQLKGITFKQWLLLVMLSKMNAGEKSLQEVADFCGSTRQNTRRMLALLEKQGYCQLVESKFDKRALNVKITTKGKHKAAQESSVVQNVMAPVFSSLTDDERAVFVHCMQKVVSALTNPATDE